MRPIDPAMDIDSNIPKKIAVIGPTQSGKTCLAVGLFSTSTKDFTIQTVDQQEGRTYLADLKAVLAGGNWPDPTNRGTYKDVRFDFLKKGKAPIRVAFPEFAGELLGSDEDFKAFANEHFRDLDGVVLLLNPGAAAFQSGDPRLLEDSMSQYKRVLAFLSDENNGSREAFVALTVTAADRLSGDLRGKLGAFEDSLEEIANTLRTSEFRWKRFNVTITGRLEEQQSPHLAKGWKNSASAPFLWLLDELNWRPRRRALWRKVRRIVLAAGVVAALGIAWCAVDAKNAYGEILKTEADCRAAIARCDSNSHPTDGDLLAIRSALGKLRNRSGWFSAQAAATADALEPLAWNAHDRRISHEASVIAGNPQKYGCDCGRVDAVFTAFVPKTPAVAAQHAEAKKRWDDNKPGYQDKYSVHSMLIEIKTPLEQSKGIHGEAAFALFPGLYGKLAGSMPAHPESIRLREELSRNLDERVGTEWREFAIPGFAAAAATNASAEATLAFSSRLNDWSPVTPNGIATKEDLLASVSNAIPAWRANFETNSCVARADKAVASGDLAELARCFPDNVATNEFLPADFVHSVWNGKVKEAFEEARRRFAADQVAAVANRRGRPELTRDDIDAIRRETNRVQCRSLLDFEATTNAIHRLVAIKAAEWDKAKRTECETWIRDHVRPSMIRTGQAGLWTAYKQFSKNNADNPFVDRLVRPAVYEQAEKWLQEDIVKFGELDCSDVSYRSKAESLFDPFRNLCREIVRDENPLRTSWAWHFAIACSKDAKIDAIESCFPQTLRVFRVEGEVEYDDYRAGYWGTYLNGSISLLAMDGTTVCSEKVMDEAAFEKSNNKSWVKIGGQKTIQIPFHLFDRVQCSLSLTDRNVSPGRELECPKQHWTFLAGTMDPIEWTGGKTFDATFDLAAASRWTLTTKDTTPNAHLRLTGSFDGRSVADFLAAAKRDAERERASLTKK